MKIQKLLAVVAVASALSISNLTTGVTEAKPAAKPAVKASNSFNVAIVDVQKIVESSPTINAIKIDRKNKLEDLAKFVEKARADVAKETSAIAKKALEDKYNKELNEKKEALDKEYFQKLANEDKVVTELIKTKAKALGYDLVLAKSNVIDGGVDITSEIIKGLK